MRTVIGSAYLVAGAVLGLSTAIWAVDRFGSAAASADGVWRKWDFVGRNSNNPYSLAHYLISGRMPPAAGQMREFTAVRSSDGALLSAACVYDLYADPAPDSWWSMAAYSEGPAGAEAHGLITSDTTINENDGSVRVTFAPQPFGGNWARAPKTGYFYILFTISEASPSGAAVTEPLFRIERSGC